MIKKEDLQIYAKKLMFDMKEEEYKTLEEEFEIIIKQMDLINNIKDIKNVEPMTFPFELKNVNLREDIADNTLTSEVILKNVDEKYKDKNQIKVPKVVNHENI